MNVLIAMQIFMPVANVAFLISQFHNNAENHRQNLSATKKRPISAVILNFVEKVSTSILPLTQSESLMISFENEKNIVIARSISDEAISCRRFQEIATPFGLAMTAFVSRH